MPTFEYLRRTGALSGRSTQPWTRRGISSEGPRQSASKSRTSLQVLNVFFTIFQVCHGYGDPHGWVWVWGGNVHWNSVPTAALQFLPARRYASAGTSYGPVSVCLCLSQVGVPSKQVNESTWFWHGSFFPPIVHWVKTKFVYLQRQRYFPLEICPKLWTSKNFASAHGASKCVIDLAEERWTLTAW